MRLVVLAVVALLVVVAAVTGNVVGGKPKVDVFPEAISRYVTGGWQGPYGDGTGGTVTPAPDGTGVYLDGTYNALAYAIRKGALFSDVSVKVNLSVVKWDSVDAEQFSFLLRWRDPVLTGQSSCPPCLDPLVSSGVVVNFNLGRNALRVTQVTDYVGVELIQVPLSYPGSGAHEVQMDYLGDSLTVYVDGVSLLSMTNLGNPQGQVGFMAYRVDVIVYSVSLTRE